MTILVSGSAPSASEPALWPAAVVWEVVSWSATPASNWPARSSVSRTETTIAPDGSLWGREMGSLSVTGSAFGARAGSLATWVGRNAKTNRWRRSYGPFPAPAAFREPATPQASPEFGPCAASGELVAVRAGGHLNPSHGNASL